MNLLRNVLWRRHNAIHSLTKVSPEQQPSAKTEGTQLPQTPFSVVRHDDGDCAIHTVIRPNLSIIISYLPYYRREIPDWGLSFPNEPLISKHVYEEHGNTYLARILHLYVALQPAV